MKYAAAKSGLKAGALLVAGLAAFGPVAWGQQAQNVGDNQNPPAAVPPVPVAPGGGGAAGGGGGGGDVQIVEPPTVELPTVSVTPRGDEAPGAVSPLTPERGVALLGALADVRAEKREEARSLLLSLTRSDLPALAQSAAQAQSGGGGLNSEQLRVLRDVVTHVYLAEEPYNAFAPANVEALRQAALQQGAAQQPGGDAARREALRRLAAARAQPGAAGGGGAVIVQPGPGGGVVVLQGNGGAILATGSGGFMGLSLPTGRGVRVRGDAGAKAGELERADAAGGAGGDGENRYPIGIVVTDLWPGFPSFRYLQEGDMIVGIDEVRPIRAIREFQAEVASHKPGETVRLRVLRRGVEREIEARVAARPKELGEFIAGRGISREAFIGARLRVAEEYWNKEFAPRLGPGGTPTTLPVQ